MNRLSPLMLAFLIGSCKQNTKIAQDAKTTTAKEEQAPSVTYSVINARNDGPNLNYDIYLRDTAAIGTLNTYLKNKYNGDRQSFIEINYFNDSLVARTYFEKQFDNAVSDKVKDKLFKSFIANYKYDPAAKYDTLMYEH